MHYKLDESRPVYFSRLNKNKEVIMCTFKEACKQETNEESMLFFIDVAKEFFNGKMIYTYFYGLFQKYVGEIPFLFHSCILDEFNRDLEKAIYFKSYSTWQDAEKGHRKAVEWVKNEYEK